jgi:hypothetical protein
MQTVMTVFLDQLGVIGGNGSVADLDRVIREPSDGDTISPQRYGPGSFWDWNGQACHTSVFASRDAQIARASRRRQVSTALRLGNYRPSVAPADPGFPQLRSPETKLEGGHAAL